MTEFEEIWNLIERKMKVPIPPYIKYVLKFCGYENCHTISTIEENDFDYFEAEVRNGGIVEFFKGEVLGEVEEDDLFKGSTKSIENFEIVRGHRKLLMAAVNVVKEKMDNGIDNLLVPSPKRKSNKKMEKATGEQNVRVNASRKKKKFSALELLNGPIELKEEDDQVEPDADLHIKHHKQILYMKALSCLKNHNSKIYEEKLQFYKQKLSEDSMQLAKKTPDSHQYTAKIKCPDCGDVLTVFHKVSSTNFGSWNVFSFERHLSSVHKLGMVTEANCVQGKGKDEIETENFDQEEDEAPEKRAQFVKKTVEFKNENIDIENDTLRSAKIEDCILVVPSSRDVAENLKYEEMDNVMIKDFSKCDTGKRINPLKIDDTASKIPETRNDCKLMFKNGAETQDESWDETKRISTTHTCAFDSVFAVYASLFSDDTNFREFLDVATLFFQCPFTTLVNLFFETNELATGLDVAQIFSAWKILNRHRNIILKKVYSSNYYESNLKIDNKIISIYCKTGLGEFFAQLSLHNQIISSAIETVTCRHCKVTKTKIVIFFPIEVINLDLSNIQQAVDSKGMKNRICSSCKKTVVIEWVYNKMLVIDLEPNVHIKNGKKFELSSLCRTIVIEKPSGGIKYKLCGVIDFDSASSHFTAHVKRKNVWSELDDLKKKQKSRPTSQRKSYRSWYSIPPITTTKVSRIASGEPMNFDTEPPKAQNPIGKSLGNSHFLNVNKASSSQSNETSKNWQRKRETGWKY